MKTIIFCVLLLSFAATTNAAPDYIIIKQRWLWWKGFKITHVDKPKKKLNKWHYDSKGDNYYRMINVFGLPMKMI